MEASYAGSYMWKLDGGQTRAQEKTADSQMEQRRETRVALAASFLTD